MNEYQSSEVTGYSSKQKAVGEIFYIFFVSSCIVIIAGVVWSIADFIMPTGKLDAFLALGLGYQIAIIGGFLAGLFFLLIFFFGLFKKGSKSLVKFIFKVRELEEKYKNRKDVKIVAGGLLLSLIAILIGVVYAILQDIILGASSGYNSFFSTFTTGNWVLFGGVGLLSILGITLFMIYFWKNGYYLILRIMGILEKEDK